MATGPVSPESIFSALFSNLTIAAAALYTSGWVYLQAYFNFFHIELSVMEFDLNETLLRSLSVARYIASQIMIGWRFILLASAVLLLVSLGRPDIIAAAAGRISAALANKAIALLLTIAVSICILVMANHAGRAQAIKSWEASRGATEIVFKKECPAPEKILVANQRGQLLLLRSTAKDYFVFSRNDNQVGRMDMRLYRIPAACVTYSFGRVQSNYEDGESK